MRVPPFHWWRTVFFLIPAIAVYTIVLGTASLVSSLFDRRGYFAHGCARAWSWLILATTGVTRRRARASSGSSRGRTYVFVSNHQSIYDIPVHLRVAAVPAAHHRQGIARAASRSSAGTCAGPATCSSIGRHPDRAGILRKWKALVGEGPVADHLSRGHAQRRRPRRRRSRPAASCWRSKRGCRSCRSRWTAAGT